MRSSAATPRHPNRHTKARRAWHRARSLRRTLEAALVAQDGATVTSPDAAVEKLILEVVSRYERLLTRAPKWHQVRSEFADLAWQLLQRAETCEDRDAAATYLRLLSTHDDGRYADLIEGTATLEITSDPEGARVLLHRVEENTATSPNNDTTTRHDSDPRDLGKSPVAPIDLAPGRYLLEVNLPNHAPARRPLIVPRGSDIRLHVALFAQRTIGPNFVYVPAGCTPSTPGSDDQTTPAETQRHAFIDNFAIAHRPVTASEFARFIDALADDDPGQAIAYTPHHKSAGTTDPTASIAGLSQGAAEAYCRWLSTQHGERYRLPTSAEWNKATLQGAFTDAASTEETPGGEFVISTPDDSSKRSALRLVRELPAGGGEEIQLPTVPESDPEILDRLDVQTESQGTIDDPQSSEETTSRNTPGAATIPATISVRSPSLTRVKAALPLLASSHHLTRARWARAGPQEKTTQTSPHQAPKTA
ncbi:MAG: SUMF1/EgtB/PvdO family nonheme iron enzyme [Deltaproteobacteria bacterium]|nr:SUMF1/EgtB/PvdO family nonheme iron enzyme [Deltaproteobacteria bacterium]